MAEAVYHVDGELVPANEATVSVRDRGFMYGDAAFETLRVYGGTPFRWTAHADRLERTCETLGFAGAVPPATELRARVDETLAANDMTDAYLKLSVTRGVQPGKLTPDAAVDPTVVVMVSDLPRAGSEGERVWDGPAQLRTVDTERVSDTALPSGAKTHNYLNGILARLELRETGADEAVLCSAAGTLTEGAASNLFFVQEDTLRTPTAELPLLPGVTREVVLECARDLGVPVETGRYRLSALESATELFVTNSTWEVRPVTGVDGDEFAVGPVTNRLQRAFDERVERLY
ncbi:MAG: branched chain amino acid aminotransferase apoenzyme [halophilic archaeon J07HX64]|jgi:branched chain amino acid aminotransferase apoenzyme (EC 2.6.1.42)|nr:MAG: branched chain amino acid aminotransferase apoenzyme [halophilic archaeon J07HX64]